MRKLTAFALILCMMANYVVTQEAVNELRVIFSPGVYGQYFRYKKDANGNLTQETEIVYTEKSGMETQVNDAYEVFRKANNFTKQVMIGHSQGGYRALGYANYLKEKGEGDMLEALICITAPARGYTPLIKGRADLALRINGLFSKISLGLLSSTKDASAAAIGATFFSVNSLLELFNVGLVSHLIDNNINSSLVNDFTPGSTYINQRINPNYSAAQGHWERRITGYRNPPRPRPRPRGEDIDQEIEYGPIPIYSNVWVIDVPPQITQTKMPPNMKLGFITASNKDLFGFLAYNITADQIRYFNTVADIFNQTNMSLFYIGTTVSKINSPLTAESDIRNAAANLTFLMNLNGAVNAAYGIAYAALATVCFIGLQIDSGLQSVAYSAIYFGKSILCFIGADTMKNLSDKYNTDLLLTNESDGFIPTAAESRDIAEMGCQRINGPAAYVVNFFDNHNSVCKDPRIWGEGGDLNQPTDDPNGLLSQWMKANGYDDWYKKYVDWQYSTQVTYTGD